MKEEKSLFGKEGFREIDRDQKKSPQVISVTEFDLSRLWIHECGKDATRYPS